MPRKRGPARKASVTKRITRFKKKFTHHVTPLQMKELLDEAKALLEEWLVNYDALEVAALADLEAKLLVTLQDIEDKLDNATWGLAALKAFLVAMDADLDKLLTGIIQGTGTVLPANKSLWDLLWLDRYDDEQFVFTWDTSVYSTNETDISALFVTPLTGTKRRKYMVYLDMTGPAGDAAAWTTCTVKVKMKINPAAYVTIDKAEKSKTDLGATEEPGIPIEVPATAKDVRITMQFDVALAADQFIYYHWVIEKMEY